MRLLWSFAVVLLLGALAPVRTLAQTGAGAFADDPLAKALLGSSVYVGKALRDHVDTSALQSIASEAPAERPLKIAVVNRLPQSGAVFGTCLRYTQALHRYLKLDQGALIIVTPQGASASTNALSPQQTSEILQVNAQTLASDPVTGIRSVASAIYGGASTSQGAPIAQDGAPGPVQDGGAGLGSLGWLVPLGVGTIVFVLLARKSAASRRAIEAARAPVMRLRTEVIEGLSYADRYLDLLPDSPDAASARQTRQEAASLLEQAGAVARAARTPEDYGRSEAILAQASAKVAECRQHIDAATGGTGMAVGVDGTDFKATPRGAAGGQSVMAAAVRTDIRPEDIPTAERGACFFCSRPSRISDLTPVTVTLNGQRRKVLACTDDVDIIKHGSTPGVRTVDDGSSRVPWYAARSYDPYRDYRTTTVLYAPGFATYPFGGGFVDGLLFGAMLADPYPMAYPLFVSPLGVPTDNFAMAAPDYGYDPGMGPAGGNFGLDSGANVDFGGGSDFGGQDPGFGGQDSGGNVDFGGQDSGGFDSGGGVDFGGGGDSGGDFGGGGDSGCGGDY